MSTAAYPVRVEAALDGHLSRWLWLVKWILVIPHYFVLAFLWIAFTLLSIVAFFAILITGRYPRAIFDFNVGVLRWSWRVTYYAYGALGTDRYPPFTLADVPDYPARLEVAYPEHLSRGLVLVKWWLLAIPQYIVVGFFVGGGAWLASQENDWQWQWGSGGLIGVLVLVSAIVLAFTGRYPRGLFDFILGMNRWALRVAGYAALMTDAYPPFRMDMGGHDPGGTLTITGPAGTPPVDSGAGAAPPVEGGAAPPPVEGGAAPPPPGAPLARTGWSGGRVFSVVAGAVLVFAGMGPLVGGAAVLWADQTQRQNGYLTSGATTLTTATYALSTNAVDLRAEGPDWAYPSSLLDTVRLRVTSQDAATPVFIGIARDSDATAYLSGVGHAVVRDIPRRGPTTYTVTTGGPPAAGPESQAFWVARASGTGTQTLTWPVQEGRWTAVVMNADSTRGVAVRADIGATVPALTWVGIALVVGGLVLLVVGAVLIAVPVARAGRR